MLDALNSTDQLPRTIFYNLRFLDNINGMIRQLDSVANNGMLSTSIGMLTDSRSFLSFPRHEYYRRILCNYIGEKVENSEFPNDIKYGIYVDKATGVVANAFLVQFDPSFPQELYGGDKHGF